MSDKRVTDRQVRRYMDSRKDRHIQVAAAARAGFSERTGRRIDGSPVLPSQRDRTRRYRTRQDPFAEVLRAELVPMLTAMPEGVKEALGQLGGVPRTHRTDRLSAANRNLSSRDDEAVHYAEFCRHYGMEPTRNNAGVSHENGSVEASHGHLKTGLDEAL